MLFTGGQASPILPPSAGRRHVADEPSAGLIEGGCMRRVLRTGTIAGWAVALAPALAAGQVTAIPGVGLGVFVPTKGSFGDHVKGAGWMGQVMLGLKPRGSGAVTFRADAQYGQVNEQTTGGTTPKDKVFGLNGDVVFHPGKQNTDARPYLLGGIGYYSVKYTAG